MKDFMGFELNVDDWVAAIRPSYRELVLGKVVAITPKKVRVEYRLHYGSSTDTHLYDSSTVVKLEGPHLTKMLLKGK